MLVVNATRSVSDDRTTYFFALTHLRVCRTVSPIPVHSATRKS